MNKNHKGFALITVLLIVFGITIISGGAYYLGMKNSTQNKIQNNLDTITPLVDKKNIDSVSTITTTSSAKQVKQIICSLSGNGIDAGQNQNQLTFFAKGKNCVTLSGFTPTLSTNESVTFNGVTKTWRVAYLSYGQANFSRDGKHFAYTASNMYIPPAQRVVGVQTSAEQFIVSDNIAGPTYDSVYYPQYSQDGNRLGYCAQKNGQYFKVIDGVETITTKDAYFNECGSLFGYNPNPEINKNLHQDITSPDGKYLLTELVPDSAIKNCNMANCAVYKVLKNISTGTTTQYGPYDMVTDTDFSPDSKHFAYTAISIDSPQYYSVVIDGKEKDHYNEIWNLEFSSDSKSLSYNARSGDTVYYIVEPL